MNTTSPSIRPLPAERSDRNTPWLWFAFALASLTTIVLFFIPAFIIRPFTHQSPRGILLAMNLRYHAPEGTLVAAIVSLIFATLLWKLSNRWLKSLIVLTLAIVAFSAVMSRLNYFEWMFHPIPSTQFVAQASSKLDSKEMILAVKLGNDARAYPISQMAYHHVLNDVVGGVPIAVTY